MIRSLDGLALRQVRTRRLRALLTAFGIVLGVGMVFGVLLLTATIRSTFDELIDSAWGKVDLVVTPESGGGVLRQSAVEEIRRAPGVEGAAGMVGSTFVRLDEDGRAIRGPKGRMWVAGYHQGDVRPYDFDVTEGRDVRSGRELIVDRVWADARGIEAGETLPVMTPAGPVRVRVVGIFELSSGLSFGGQGLAGMPLPEARELMNLPEGWYQVSVVATERDRVADLQRRLQKEMGTAVKVQTPSGVADDISEQLQALNVVLYFFSGVALFVGGFLILNAFNMTVLQRMRELGTLRTLGAGRRDVLRTVLAEAVVLGVIGTALGLLLGLGLAKGLLAAISALDVPVSGLKVTAGAAVTAIVLGLVVTVAGAAWPAARASRIPPIRAVLGEGEQRRSIPLRRAVVGLALFLPGLVYGGRYWFGNEQASEGVGAVLGVGGTMLMFAGMATAAPFLITPLVRLLSVPLRRLFPTAGRLAADAARSNPARTSATAVALTIGLSVIVVNSAMSTSLLNTVSDQLDASLARDLTVRPVGTTLEQGGVQTVPVRAQIKLAALPDAGTVTPVRSMLLDLPGLDDTQGLAMGVDPAAWGEVDRTPVSGAPSRAEALRGVARGGVILGKPYARAADVDAGDRIRLVGPRLTIDAPVVGTIEQMNQFGGLTMQMSHDTMRRVYGTTGDAELAMTARSPDRRAAFINEVRTVLDEDYRGLEGVSSAELEDDARSQIDQQFAFFNAIVGVAVIVSLLGVINTLAMSVLERTREIGVLRALGYQRRLVRVTMLDESLLITVSGALAGIAIGVVIGYIWILSASELLPGMTFAFPWATAFLVTLAAIAFGVVAAILPARRAARLKVVEALQYE